MKSYAILGLVVLGLAFVMAGVVLVYQHSHFDFTKTINATITPSNGGGNGGDENTYENVSILANGDSINSTIDCIGTDTCQVHTDNVLLTNPFNENINCSVTSTGDNVLVSYNTEVNPITVPANENVSFQINYIANSTGAYPIQTSIDC